MFELLFFPLGFFQLKTDLRLEILRDLLLAPFFFAFERLFQFFDLFGEAAPLGASLFARGFNFLLKKIVLPLQLFDLLVELGCHLLKKLLF